MRRTIKRSLPALNKKLWAIFSQYIRRKDADKNGMVGCISCANVKHWKEMDAGHYIAKSTSLALRFDERNVNPQCTACNRFRHGNMAQYAWALQLMHGPNILMELNDFRRDNQHLRMTRFDYEYLIEKYKKKLIVLEGPIIGGR